MKGFAIMIDGIIALIVAMSMILLISSRSMSMNSGAWSSVQVKRVSMDSLAILEKTGVLDRTVQTNSSSEVDYFMSNELQNLCTELKISGNGYAISTAKANCSIESGRSVITRRSFISGGEVYIAEMHASVS